MKYKVLVAEDETIERMVLCKILRKYLDERITIFEARDGEEAIEVVTRESPQVAILDIEMPGKSGLEVARWMRKNGNPCSILFLTGFDNFSYAKQAIEVHALDYILKPYEDNELIFAAEEAIQIYERLSKARKLLQQPEPEAAQTQAEITEEDVRSYVVREEIRRYIDSNYMNEISMQDAASALGYTDTYFCKLFKQCFKVNFSAYLNSYRIEKAKALICSSRSSIKQISAACGYSDSTYFGRVFKQLTGQTPSEYRLRMSGKTMKE